MALDIESNTQLADDLLHSPAAENDEDRHEDAADRTAGAGIATGTAPRRKIRRLRHPMPPHRQALLIGITMLVALTAVGGWLGWRVHQARQVADQRAAFVQAARQGAVNLTTVDWQHADADVQRILNSATGEFYDDFSKRSQPFIDVLKQAQSKSEGTVTVAGLESASNTDARVLVAVSVMISNAGVPEQYPRSWRMRIAVQKLDDHVKVSNVEFVP
jgi:Mce-associated membrane protein